MTTVAANAASTELTPLPLGPAPSEDLGLAPSAEAESAQSGLFGLLLTSLVSAESDRPGNPEEAGLRPALEELEESGEIVEPEVDGESSETPNGLADADLATFSEAASGIVAEGSGEDGHAAAPEQGRMGESSGAHPESLGAEGARAQPDAAPHTALRPDAAAHTAPGAEPSIPAVEAGSSERAGEVAHEGTRSFTSTIVERGVAAEAPRSPETGAEPRTSEAQVDRGEEKARRLEPIAPQGDRGESSGSESGRHAPASALPPEGTVDPGASRIEGTARGESASAQSSLRALPELPASNENEIVRGARVLVQEGGGTARIQLFPPELGGLEIRVAVSDRAIQLRFVADRAAVAELLNHHLPELRHVLQLPGLAVERVEIVHREPTVTRDERDSGNDGSFDGGDDGGEAQREASRDGGELDLAENWLGPWSAPARASASVSGLRSLGAVDVRA